MPRLRAWKRTCWNVLRLVVAGAMLWTVIADAAARRVRLELASLPFHDAAPDIAQLRAERRYGEAVVVADAAIEAAEARSDPPERIACLKRERELTIAEQASVVRRARDLGMGALTGGAGLDPRAISMETLIGAVATDMLVVGDVRDLCIQGYQYATTGQADKVIVALSTAGIVLTLAPEIDWAPALLKAARKAGTVGERLGEFIIKSAKGGRIDELRSLLVHTATLARRSSPGSAVRLLKLAQTPDDVARIARFVQRRGKAGAAALHATGGHGAAALRIADELRAAGRAADAARIEAVLVRAAEKGPAGAGWLGKGSLRVLTRPHPLVGALKGVYKGTLSDLVQRALEALDARAWWVLPLLASWFGLEALLLGKAVFPSARRHSDSAPRAGRMQPLS